MWLKKPDGEVVEIRRGSLSDWEIQETQPMSYLLRTKEKVIPFYGFREHDIIHVWMNGAAYQFEILHAPEMPSKSRIASFSEGEVISITAPMPGKILSVLVQPEDKVEINAPVVILESMKMEMSLTAPIAGRIEEINCKPGDLVQMGQMLVRLEPVS